MTQAPPLLIGPTAAVGRTQNGGGEGRENEWMTCIDALYSVVHCVSYTDHGMHVVEEHCRKE